MIRLRISLEEPREPDDRGHMRDGDRIAELDILVAEPEAWRALLEVAGELRGAGAWTTTISDSMKNQ